MGDRVFEKYLHEMGIVRHRIRYIERVTKRWLGKPIRLSRTRVEAIALQARLTCEGIILAGAHANAEIYGNFFKRIENEWQLSQIRKIMARENKFFAPLPCKYGKDRSGKSFIIAKKEDAVAIEEIEAFHGKVATLLHHRHINRVRISDNAVMQMVVEMNYRLKRHLRQHTIMVPTGERREPTRMRVFVVRMHFSRNRPVEGWDIKLSAPDASLRAP